MQAEIHQRLSLFATGITRYNAASRVGDDTHGRAGDIAEVWRQGTTRLYDYGTAGSGAGTPVLVVPSLINRASVLDLQPDRSFLRALAAAGHRPLLVDWDWPGDDERDFTLSDYIAGRLAAALDAATDLAGGPVAVIGYCMGGTLAVPLAQIAPDQIRSLILMAAPWDFDAMTAPQVRLLQADRARFETLINAQGHLPVDVLQAMFTSLDPFLALRKFSRFAEQDPASDEARHFVALEDWLNDGVPLVGAVARECLIDWYGRNTPGRGLWQVAGDAVRPRAIACPTLVVVPSNDTIVPPASATPLGQLIPQAETVTQAAGHIGMVAGRNGPAHLYPLIADWLQANRSAL